MRRLICSSILAVSLIGATAASARAPQVPLPAGWSLHGSEGAAQCGVENDVIRFMEWGIRGSQTLGGRSYAYHKLGFVMAAPRGWPSFPTNSGNYSGGGVDVTVRWQRGSVTSSGRNTFSLIDMGNGLIFAEAKGDPLNTMRQLAASGGITIELPRNYRGYQPHSLSWNSEEGRKAFVNYRNYCDDWAEAGYYAKFL